MARKALRESGKMVNDSATLKFIMKIASSSTTSSAIYIDEHGGREWDTSQSEQTADASNLSFILEPISTEHIFLHISDEGCDQSTSIQSYEKGTTEANAQMLGEETPC